MVSKTNYFIFHCAKTRKLKVFQENGKGGKMFEKNQTTSMNVLFDSSINVALKVFTAKACESHSK